jgi:hypothetical protein
MARRKDIAGLAALGALGMMLSGKGENKGAPSSYNRDTDTGVDALASASGASDRNENYSNEGMRTGNSRGTVPIGKTPRAPSRARLTGDDNYNPDVQQGRVAGQGGPRGTRYNEPDASQSRVAGQGGPRGTRYNETTAAPAAQSTRRLSSAEALAQLDRQTGVRAMDPNADRGPNAITSTELGRNVSNTLGALTPIGGGVGKVAAELPYMGRAQKAYNQRAALRRSEEGLNADEAAAAQERIRQASFDGGMKRGGKVKKMASGGMTKTSASSRGDGIAMRGKTRGMMR